MDIKEIKPLIEKYLDGSTTNEEEETLRTFFSSPRANMPEEWRVYRALFDYEVGQRRSLHTSTDNRLWTCNPLRLQQFCGTAITDGHGQFR